LAFKAELEPGFAVIATQTTSSAIANVKGPWSIPTRRTRNCSQASRTHAVRRDSVSAQGWPAGRGPAAAKSRRRARGGTLRGPRGDIAERWACRISRDAVPLQRVAEQALLRRLAPQGRVHRDGRARYGNGDGDARRAWPAGRPIFYPADWSPLCSDQMALYDPSCRHLASMARRCSASPSIASGAPSVRAVSALEVPLLADFEPKGEVARRSGSLTTLFENQEQLGLGLYAAIAAEVGLEAGQIPAAPDRVSTSSTSARTPTAVRTKAPMTVGPTEKSTRHRRKHLG